MVSGLIFSFQVRLVRKNFTLMEKRLDVGRHIMKMENNGQKIHTKMIRKKEYHRSGDGMG